MTSVDNGLTWTERSAFPNTWNGIAFGGLAFVAVTYGRFALSLLGGGVSVFMACVFLRIKKDGTKKAHL